MSRAVFGKLVVTIETVSGYLAYICIDKRQRSLWATHAGEVECELVYMLAAREAPSTLSMLL